MHKKFSLGSNGVDRVYLLQKIPTRLRGTNFCTTSRFCTEYRKATKRSRVHPNSIKHTKTSVYSAMGRIGCVRCEKFRRDFVAQTFALLRPVLHRVSYGNQTVPNAPKLYKTHEKRQC